MSVKNFWVQLYGGPPWGFRMREVNWEKALVISRVNSKGRQQGLKEGDRVLSVNGRSTSEMTHGEAQRVIRESSTGVELHLERSTGSNESNGFNADQNGNMSTVREIELQLNSLQEEANHAGSWSTDSTSTGSTTIHVASQNSDDTSASENVWSPSSKKRTNLHLNLHNTTTENIPTHTPPLTQQQSSNTQQQTTSSTTKSVSSSATRSVKVTSSSNCSMEDEEKSPVWQPFGAPYDGPQFRPVKLGVARSKGTSAPLQNETSKKIEINSIEEPKPESPKPAPKSPKVTTECTTAAPEEKSIETDNSAEEALAQNSSTTFTKTGWSSHLPPSQSPTITLLQKAREGQIPKGAVYIEEKSESTPIPRNAVLIDQKVTVEGDKVHTDSYYAVPTLTTEVTTRDQKAPPKYDGIGPTEYGIPVGLRTAVKEEYASDWYKTMYKSLHRNKFPNETNQTVHLGGYMSEPEYERKDKLRAKYLTDHRRIPEKSVSYTNQETTQQQTFDKSRLTADSSVARHEPRREAYRVEPRSIADYEPGRSSLAEKEFEKHEHLGPVSPRPSNQGLNRRWPNVLLSDGYESDSTLIRKTGRNPEIDPDQQKAWYKEIQKGGEIPLTGLRKTVPEKLTEISKSRPEITSHVLDSHKNLSNIPLPSSSYTFRAKPMTSQSPSKVCATMNVKNKAPTPPARVSSTNRLSILTSQFPKNSSDAIFTGKEKPLSEDQGSGIREHSNKKTPAIDLNLSHSSNPIERYEQNIIAGKDIVDYSQHENGGNRLISTNYSFSSMFDELERKFPCEHSYPGHFQNVHRKSWTGDKDPSCVQQLHDKVSPSSQNSCRSCQMKRRFGAFQAEQVLNESYGDTLYLLIGEDGKFEKEIDYRTKWDARMYDNCEGKPSSLLQRNSVRTISTENKNADVQDVQFPLQNESSNLTENNFKSSKRTGIEEYGALNGHCKKEEQLGKHPENYNKFDLETLKKGITGLVTNKLNCSSNVKRNSPLCLKENNSFPRMISLSQPFVQVLPTASVTKLNSQIVHSVPQNYKKLKCTLDVKPLQEYLKKYGDVSSDKVDNKILQNTSVVEMFLKDFDKTRTTRKITHHFSNTCASNKYDKILYKSVLPTARVLSHLEFPNNITSCQDQIMNSEKVTMKGAYSKNIPFITHKNGMGIKSCSYSTPNIAASSKKNSINLSLNQQNALIYHEYIASMLSTASKSRSFVKLKKFYSSLENLSSTGEDIGKFQPVGMIGISWKRIYYHRWNKNQDMSLKVRPSSVEDLRKLFQNDNTKVARSCHTTFEMSFQYKRLLYSVSVSNLVEKYNNLQCFQKLEIQAKLSDLNNAYSSRRKSNNRLDNKTNELNSSQKTSHPSIYQLPSWNLLSYRLKRTLWDGPQINQRNKCILTPIPTANLQTQEILPDVQSKVKFFEEVSHNNSSFKQNFSKLTHLKRNNLSCFDLRQIDETNTTNSYSNYFSSNYLPEKAVSCLDLSCTSLDSTNEHSNHYCVERSSSSVSFVSSECTTKGSSLLGYVVGTGTVARIRNQLENLQEVNSTYRNSKMKSSSVPNNLPFVSSRLNVNKKRRSFFNKNVASVSGSSGSVQNLIQKFEPELQKARTFPRNFEPMKKHQPNGIKHNGLKFENNQRYLSYRTCTSESVSDMRTITDFASEAVRNSSDFNSRELPESNGNCCKSALQISIRRRIPNLIARFENQNSSKDIPTSKVICQYGGPKATSSETDGRSNGINTFPTTKLNFGQTHEWSFSNLKTLPAHLCNSNSNTSSIISSEDYSERISFKKLYTNSRLDSELSPMRKGFLKASQMHLMSRVKNSSPRPYRKYTDNSSVDIRTASPHQYQETQVNIHYKSPIRHLEKEYIEEEEFRKIQEDALRKLYEEERRKKHQQEMAEIEMRRHCDFFTPSQKSPIALNRYDDPFQTSYSNKLLAPPSFSRGPAPKTMARALYPFQSQTARELSLGKGDIVYINKQIDKNWYEGEHHGLVGIFPVSYVEIIPTEKANLQPRKPIEGEALVKYNFPAQSPKELSLFKGEKVILLRKLDHNWYEGRLGTKKGIFPVSYVKVLQEPREQPAIEGNRAISPKPPKSTSPIFSSVISETPFKAHETTTYNTGLKPLHNKPPLQLETKSLTQSLHIDTYNEPIPYRSLYSYKPQNDDELELKDGDTVYVMEKCDDGWYVGTSLRTGLFGTFPGNYVERI